MLSISRVWFALMLATSLGVGVGAGILVSPSDYPEQLKAACEEIEQAQKPSLKNTKPQNSPGKGF
jgi:hypothetical protein